MKKILYLISILMLGQGVINAQVTIGTDKEPMEGSLLELISTNPTAPKGLRLPLLTNAEVEIFVSHINALPAEDKARAVGMLIFNTSINCSMVWNGKEFKSLCGDVGPAEIMLVCEDVRVFPNSDSPDYTPTGYQQGKVIDGFISYILLPVVVSKAGTYDIIARTGNGYSFAQHGTLLEVGDHLLRLPASGTPIEGNDSPQYYDHIISLVINDNDATTICKPADMPAIPVAPAIGKAKFTMDCSQCSVNGVYNINQAVSGTHNIKVKVNVKSGGYYSFEASAAGVHFCRNGIWLPTDIGDKEVILYASGTPTIAGPTPILITGETSTGKVSCLNTLNVAYRSIKVLCFGADYYSGANINCSINKILKSDANFGMAGTVPAQSITIVDGAYNENIKNLITSNNPDIIIIGYNFHPGTIATAALVDFINNKNGFVIMMAQDNAPADGATLSAIMGSAVTVGIPQSGGSGAGNVRPFAVNSTCPLLNGPFLNVGGKYWGEDAGTTFCIMSALPAGFEALSTNNTIVWKKNGNFVYIGDGGFAIGSLVDISPTVYPCAINADGSPAVKTQYTNGGAYNSYFFANIIAYAIKWAQDNR
ncbi:MAG: hypothetical protein LBB53_05310 [Prevotellaceae bacterium]|jgi:hypothetical protein|nr:hypothetical protein [Prevotellaceae bacterium]